MKNIIVLIFFFISSQMISQNLDYVVTIQKDTIYGEKLKGARNYSVRFKNNRKVLYGPNEIISYYIAKHKRHMERVISPFDYDEPGQMTFLSRLTNGRIKLFYESYGVGTTYVANLFISKNGEKLKSLPTGGGFAQTRFAKKTTYEELKPYIADNSKILNELDSIKPTAEAFIELINKYNNSFREIQK